ncbi:MAG: hypothetical protein JWR52_3641 [Marmoricola sp.]|nr:hypothetical protein [Marmoricola sp.]
MPTAEEFDEFYVATRRGLVLQTFAVTGDLAASRSAVRDAYVAARHHWAKVGTTSDPEGWVRPRAWAAAQRRHTVRPWHRERHVTSAQAAVLEALHALPDVQRRALVLTHLTTLPADEVAREIGLPPVFVAEHLSVGTEAFAASLGIAPADVPAQFEELGSAADSVKLPRPMIVRRNGIRRRRNHMLIGSVLIVAITVLAGAFVAVDAPAAPPPRAGKLVSTRMLLTAPQLSTLSPAQPWLETGTSDNTTGTGINTDCQASRFADPDGLGTWVRKFSAAGKDPKTLVQTVEISNSPGAARAAYATTLGWFAGCATARVQLIDAYAVSGVGEQAQILRLRIPDKQDRSFTVGLARTGALTTSTVVESQSDTPVDAHLVSAVLASSVADLCYSKVAGGCITTVSTVATLPPKSGETVGMLAIADLPTIATVAYPWVGTDPVDASTFNAAATPCDNANFAGSGATRPVTRTFLIPQAHLPARFGLTETIGRFSSTQAAIAFSDLVVARLKTCPKKELGSTVTQQTLKLGASTATSYALWRIQSQVNKQQDKVMYWMGIARVGRYVAQINLTPVQPYDISQPAFLALVTRARDRLFEVH